MHDRIEDDFRRSLEFVVKVKQVYSFESLKKMHYLTFFRVLEESEQELQEQTRRIKESGQ